MKKLARRHGTGTRAWQRMLSGRRLDLLDPSPLDIEIEDIAHGLARVARWNGQTKGDHAFSVAQHCLWSRASPPCRPAIDQPARLAALLHDAPEYVIGDMISPFKAALGLDYKAFEKPACRHPLALRPAGPDAIGMLNRNIKKADRMAAYLEATELAGFSEGEAGIFSGGQGLCSAGRGNSLAESLAPDDAATLYLKKFKQLS